MGWLCSGWLGGVMVAVTGRGASPVRGSVRALGSWTPGNSAAGPAVAERAPQGGRWRAAALRRRARAERGRKESRMNRIIAAGASLLALVLAGCGDADQPENVTKVEVPSGEAYQERLLELNDMARNAVFLRALMDANQDCQQVTQSAFLGRYKGAPAWSATCFNRGEWLVLIGNDGVAQVISRHGAEAAGVLPSDGGNEAGGVDTTAPSNIAE